MPNEWRHCMADKVFDFTCFAEHGYFISVYQAVSDFPGFSLECLFPAALWVALVL